MHERDRDVANLHYVAALVLHQIALGESAGLQYPRCLVALHVHGATAPLQQRRHTFHRVAHHVPADVVGVEVGGEHPGHLHTVGLHEVEELVDGVGRIDQHALVRRPVADGVGEVDHLLRNRILRREVSPRKQLAKVEAVGRHGHHATVLT